MVVFDDVKESKSWYKQIISVFEQKKSGSNFYQRAIIAFIATVLTIFVTIMGGLWFSAAVLLATVIISIELTNMIHNKQLKENRPNDDPDIMYFKKITLPYILIPALSLLFIRGSVQGSSIMVWMILNVASVDSAGYVVGSLFGKNKLYPSISPNKTIEGAMGGILAGLVITVITFPIMCLINGSNPTGFSFYTISILSLMTSVLCIIGDLFESHIKRQCGVKDSGGILLSHGGFMDRLDSLTFVAPVIAILVLVKRGIFF